jgi:hypothetical protein
MSELGVGRAFSILSWGVVLSCAVACATSERDRTEQVSEAPAGTFAGMRKNPEQVVQRMEPQSGRVAQADVTRADVTQADVTRAAVARAAVAERSGARAQSHQGAAAATQDGQLRAAEHITPRHLEAELNRLEAELAN